MNTKMTKVLQTAGFVLGVAVLSYGTTAYAGNADNGKTLYTTCMGCHGVNLGGGVGPKLSNRSAEEMVSLMNRYKAGEQVGPMTALMAPMVANLSDSEILDLAAYIASVK